MAFGTQDDTDEVMNEINMTPLVDVMLVLLIIFIITVPVMQHAVNLDLPHATVQPERVRPETIQLSVDAQGGYFWNGAPLSLSALSAQMVQASLKPEQPELHIRADRAVRYEFVANAMAEAQRAGLRKISFVTTPKD
jgi:biopolymer transport protein ExbD